MDADHGALDADRGRKGRQRSGEPIAHIRSRETADEALVRRAVENRMADCREIRQGGEQSQIAGVVLAETTTGIEPHAVGADSGSDSSSRPIAQELVDEGMILGFAPAFHAWGDEWNVVYLYMAESIPAFLSAFGEAVSRMTERYPEAMTMFQDWCSEHKDSFLSLGEMTHSPEP